MLLTIVSAACHGDRGAARSDGEAADQAEDQAETDDGDLTDGLTDDGDLTDDDHEDGLCAAACGTPNCGSCPAGPLGITITNYAIDSTEVTYGQYALFLEVAFATAYPSERLGAECAFKTDFKPDNWPVNPDPGKPVTGVDWCDAAAYCAWSGKRLCGEIGGEAAAIGDVANPGLNEWHRACTGGGITTYPYGATYDPNACNTMDAGLSQYVEVASLLGCEGGVAGLFDMSGNVWEWTNACDAAGECQRRGGSYFSGESTSRCAVVSTRAREFRNGDTGLRCCESDP